MISRNSCEKIKPRSFTATPFVAALLILVLDVTSFPGESLPTGGDSESRFSQSFVSFSSGKIRNAWAINSSPGKTGQNQRSLTVILNLFDGARQPLGDNVQVHIEVESSHAGVI